MDKDIIKEIKDVIQIKNWSDIKTKEQFYILVSYMYCIDYAVNEEIVMSIDNIEMLIEECFNEYIDLIIDLEPSIMVVLVDTNSVIMEMFEQVNKPEIRKKIARELKNFSQWLMMDSKVRYMKNKESFVVSVFAAINIVKENQEDEDKNFKLKLITERRQNLLKDLEDLVRHGIDFGDTPYFSTKSDTYGKNSYYEEIDDDYEDDYYLN